MDSKKYIPPSVRRQLLQNSNENSSSDSKYNSYSSPSSYGKQSFGGSKFGGSSYQNKFGSYSKKQYEKPSYSNDNNYRSFPPSNNSRWGGDKKRYEPYGFKNKYHRKEISEEELFKSGVKTGLDFDKYDNIPIDLKGKDKPNPIESFSSIEFAKPLQDNIKRADYSKPTPVQKYSIPIGVNKRDLMACAQTGSGKTAAFLFPIIHLLMANGTHVPDAVPFGSEYSASYSVKPKALIIAPTRELATQIYDEARKFCYKSPVRPKVCYGGADISHQIYNIRGGCSFLVGTPGRISDLIKRGVISMTECTQLVLDEADRMLDMGFKDQIEEIVLQSGMPGSDLRQTMMFSATFPKEIRELAIKFLNNYLFLIVGRIGSAVESVQQIVTWAEDNEKLNKTLEILKSSEENGLILIFVKTKKGADYLEKCLTQNNLPAVSIHGDRSQREREYALNQFKKGYKGFLVATDVASRGLDIPNVTHVINYDLPENIDDYVHRIGRTSRLGNTGVATSFFNDNNYMIAKDLVKTLKDCNQPIPEFLYAKIEELKYSKNQKKKSSWGGGYNKSGGWNSSSSYNNNSYSNNSYNNNSYKDSYKDSYNNNSYNNNSYNNNSYKDSYSNSFGNSSSYDASSYNKPSQFNKPSPFNNSSKFNTSPSSSSFKKPSFNNSSSSSTTWRTGGNNSWSNTEPNDDNW